MARIIAGRLKGRSFDVPKGRSTRPTLGRVREALFSMLEARLDIDGTHVLDICAGSGGLALEAISRGAQDAVAIESNRRTADLIKENARALDLAKAVRVVRKPVPAALSTLRREFDIVFFDPPFDGELYVPVLLALGRSILAVDGILSVEHDARRSLELPNSLEIDVSKTYGDVAITLVRRAHS